MFARILLLFIVVPLVELALLIKVGQLVGVWPTISLVILTGIAGASLAKHEGLSVLRRIERELEFGRLPTTELLDGFLILAGGLLLLTPGFITDTIGFLCLLPPTRILVRAWIRRRFEEMIRKGQTRVVIWM